MRTENKRKIFLAVIFAFVICIPLSHRVNATATLTPVSASTILDGQAQFTCTGLNASDTYAIKLGSTTVYSGQSPTTAGVLAFSVGSSVAGTYTVYVYNEVYSSNVASATLIVSDVLADMMPYIVLLVSFVIVFGVVKQLKFK